FAAEVYKSYLHCASKIIKNQDGVITAFDGDRIMAVFIGDRKCTNAAKAALQLNFSVSKIINPCIKLKFPETTFIVSHGVGIDMSKLFVARTGVRGANDLVWVGRAANYAAKLCAIREEPYKVFVTKRVYDRMNDSAKTGSENNVSMWQKKIWTFNNATIYASSWIWRV
ncbi:MAG TPA: adenylate/guanylate cyclase domain-containing protein, partial [Verrucomicrobiae bacterium]|nr:adenylate/guanylate cyclase domain-containing protein [Verrucomicrobiae bacterium]